MKYNFPISLLDYVRRKCQSFLEKNGLESKYKTIEEMAQKDNNLSLVNYINELLNNTVSVVAEKRNADWNEIKDEFCIHYLQ